jgi:uncharacterized membrane protein
MLDSLILSAADFASLAFFLAAWLVHGQAASGRLVKRVSLSQAMNAQRAAWMHSMARRELRMIDTGIMVGLQQGTAFFASSSLIAVGGCFALLNGSAQVAQIMADLPYAAPYSRLGFEVKVFGLIAILAYSFFKFGWAYRLFNYCSILVGAVPMISDPGYEPAQIWAAADRAARMNMLAGSHFNSGLRGVFFSIGYLGWFINPLVFALTTCLLFAVLMRRQFFSEARLVALGEMGRRE